MAPAKKGTRGRATSANKVTKPSQVSSHRPRGRLAAAKEVVKQKSISEKTSNAQISGPGRGRKARVKDDAVPDSLLEDDEESAPEPARGRATRGQRKVASGPALEGTSDAVAPPAKPATRGRGKPAEEIAPEVPESPKPTRRRQGKMAGISTETEVVGDFEETADTDTMDADMRGADEIEDLPSSQRGYSILEDRTQAIAPFSVSRRPPNAVEPGTTTSDPTLRRRLGELTQKYDSLELKYKDLREVGVKEAERNYDRLKKQSEERANTATQLIASLKAELAAQTALAKEAQHVQQQLEESESKVEALQARVDELNTALADAKAETKTLSTKLAASRTAEVAAPKYPGSAMKNGVTVKGQAGNNEAVQLAQMKGELYCDLTGLIITGVKKETEEDVFDCIQTGRNGTLHFKLAVANESASDSYDEAEFMYKPQLDSNRDRALIEVLPEYLSDEITFPRPQASKFYARVMKALTE